MQKLFSQNRTALKSKLSSVVFARAAKRCCRCAFLRLGVFLIVASMPGCKPSADKDSVSARGQSAASSKPAQGGANPQYAEVAGGSPTDPQQMPGSRGGRDKWEERVRGEFIAAIAKRVTMQGSTWTFTKVRLPNLWAGGIYRTEVRNVKVAISPDYLSEADKLNGIQWRGEVTLNGSPCREALIANQEYATEIIGPLAGMFTDRILIPTNRVALANASWSDWTQNDYFSSGVAELKFKAAIRANVITWNRYGDPSVMWLVPQGKETNRLEALLVDFEK